MARTPPASNTGPVDTIEHETANDALTNHNGRPDMFVMVAEEGVQNKKDTAKEDEQHATAADEDDFFYETFYWFFSFTVHLFVSIT